MLPGFSNTGSKHRINQHEHGNCSTPELLNEHLSSISQDLCHLLHNVFLFLCQSTQTCLCYLSQMRCRKKKKRAQFILIKYCATQEPQLGNLQFILRSENSLHWQEKKLRRLSPTDLSASSSQEHCSFRVEQSSDVNLSSSVNICTMVHQLHFHAICHYWSLGRNSWADPFVCFTTKLLFWGKKSFLFFLVHT